MLAFLSITGILLSVLLLFFNARKNQSTIYLALLNTTKKAKEKTYIFFCIFAVII
jgi:hypothetical protein